MRITYMGLIGESILQYNCTLKEAKTVCEDSAEGPLVWDSETEGVHLAEDMLGHQFSVVQYQRA